MRILGVETSCDETAAAVVEDGRIIMTSAVASSADMQIKYGGIVPELAARKQVEMMPSILAEAMMGIELKEIDALAVANGPGLIGSLLIGVETTKSLAYLTNKPIIPVNHLRGHLYSAWLKDKNNFSDPEFPLVGLLVSGGHTELIYMKSHKKLKVLGETRDDAAGEAFDKIARMLKLPYPGGPAIELESDKFEKNNLLNQTKINFLKELPILPRPMLKSKDYDFSFSGLKTAVFNLINRENQKTDLKKINIDLLSGWLAKETEAAICEVLTYKLFLAVNEFQPASIILAGGVAANKRLRKITTSLALKTKVKCFIPPAAFCTDNAANIAGAAFFNNKQVSWKKITVKPNLRLDE